MTCSSTLARSSEGQWKSLPLGELLLEIRNGLTAQQEKEPPGIPVTRIETISKGVIDLERVRYIREPVPANIDRFWLKQGDILFSHINSDLHLGKTAVVTSDVPLLHGMNLLLLRPDTQRLRSRFLHHVLDFYRRSGRFMAIAQHAVNQSSLNQKKLTSLCIVLPPVEEQDGIVAEIEKQFSRLDEAVAGLQRAKANLKRYKAAVLKSAVTGRLVPTEADLARREGRNYETGAELLQRILETRRSQWQGKGKYKEPAAPDTAGLPELPEGWMWGTADQLTDADRAITYGVIKLGDSVDSGVSVLRSSDVRWLRIELDSVKTISTQIAANYQRTFLRGGEVVMTVRGTLGGIAVVPPECRGFNVSREVAMLALVEPGMAHAVANFIASSPIQRWLMGRTKGIAYTGINIETLKELPLPVPPLPEQHRIVAEVDRLLSIAREAEAEVDANLKRAQGLRQAILGKAFTPTD